MLGSRRKKSRLFIGFLSRDGRRCGIIDTGLGIDVFRKVSLALHRLRVFPEWVLLTHDHYDHVANAGWFKDEMGVPIYCHGADSSLIEQPLKVFDEGYMRRTYGTTLRESFGEMNRSENEYLQHMDDSIRDRFYPVRIDETVEDGDILEVGGLEVELMHTPGHSPGHVSVYLPRFGAIFAGDAPLWFGPGRPGPLGSFRDWVESMERLLLLDTEFIGWGHAVPTRGRSRCHRFLNNTLRRALEVESAVVEEIGVEPQTVGELVEMIYGDNVGVLEDQRKIAEDSVHSLLASMSLEGRVETVCEDGVTRWRERNAS
ncbi:MAG: MBL fold metallo-hydrolase [Bacillota bacterium]